MRRDGGDKWAIIWAIIVFAGCVVGACGRISGTTNHGPFESYFQDFLADAARYGRNVSADRDVMIEFGDIPEQRVAAQCQTHFLYENRIVVVKKIWDDMTDASRESLLYHELGHCILKRDHIKKSRWVLPAGDAVAQNPVPIPGSLMRPVYVDGADFLNYRDYYCWELFTQH